MNVQVDNLGVGKNATNVGNILPSVDKTTEKEDISTVKIVTESADSVTLSSEAIALSQVEQERNGGDGNGEKPTKP